MKKNRNKICLAAATCAACLLMTACGSTSANSRSKISDTETETAVLEVSSESVTETKTFSGLSEATLCGIWGVDHALINGSSYTLAELEAANEYSLSNFYMVFKEGGSFYVTDGSDNATDTWTISGNNIDCGDTTLSYSDEDETIALDSNGNTICLIRISESQDITNIPAAKAVSSDSSSDSADSATASSGSEASSGSASSDSSEVSPDFKATMDGYEEFFDEYVEFMKKYSDSDDPMSMLSDYASMMSNYAETMSQMDSIDTDSLSSADYAYYIDVTARIEKKLLEAY